MNESAFIAALRGLATHPAARGLADDAAVLEVGDAKLVLTHDMIVEGVHFLPGDPAEDVAWKLLAVNLSDLAGKGARPLGVLLGFTLAGNGAWDRRFVTGLDQALSGFDIPLLGGDTVAMPAGAPRALGLTAIGTAAVAPSRSGGQTGDDLWVSGAIGDAGAGLRIARGEAGLDALIARYRRPRPRLELGEAIAPLVHAMMDISDGLLLDASRMAEASGLAAAIDLDQIPLSDDYLAFAGDDRDARLAAATAGDDYELLFAAAPERGAELLRLGETLGISVTRVGRLSDGGGLFLGEKGEAVPLPGSLGFEHGRATPHG